MNTPAGYYILAMLPPVSAVLVGILATYAQRPPRTKYTNSELIAYQRAKIDRKSGRKTTTQQNRTKTK